MSHTPFCTLGDFHITCTVRDDVSALVSTLAFCCCYGTFESLSDLSEETLRGFRL